MVVPLIPNTRDAIIAFYRSPPRCWKLDEAASSVFKVKFFRGNWGVSKLATWLGKIGLNRFVGDRRAQAPAVDGAKVLFESWPAELTVTTKAADAALELLMVYEVALPGGAQTMSRDDKKKWKAAVEEDAYHLAIRLQDLSKRR